MDEKQILKRVQEGEIDLYGKIIHTYSSKMLHYISQRVRDKEDAKDILQNSFIKAYKSIDSFNINKPFYPYFFSIVRNEMNTFFRKNPTLYSLEYAHTIVKEESQNYIDWNSLKREYRKVLKWYGEGFSYKEIAKKMNKPLNTVKTLIRRAKNQFIKNYEK